MPTLEAALIVTMSVSASRAVGKYAPQNSEENGNPGIEPPTKRVNESPPYETPVTSTVCDPSVAFETAATSM
jgi:hypothetical protein